MMPHLRLLVTGASGSIGRRLRTRLSFDGNDAAFIVSPRSGASSVDQTVDVVDITDSAQLNAIVKKRKPAAIIHLASVSGKTCEADAERAVRVNVDAVRSLVEIAEANGVSRFVLASTSAVYGDQYESPVGETGEIVLGSIYAQTKWQAETILAAATNESACFSAVALRIFNVYGPGMRKSLANRLMGATPDSPVTLAGLDDFVRDYVHVDDVVEALVRASVTPLTAQWLIANVGSGRPTSNRDLVAALEPVYFITEERRSSYSCAATGVASSSLGFTASHVLNRSSLR